MTSLAAVLVFVLFPGIQDPAKPSPKSDAQDSDRKTADQLVTELASPDPAVRDWAESELLKRGKSALPALREASRSNNAEQAMRARGLLMELAKNERGTEPQDPKDETDRGAKEASPAPRMSVLYEDWSRGIHFTLGPDGDVELRAPEKEDGSDRREYKTYRAASIEEFKQKYPDIARKYGIDKLVSTPGAPLGDAHRREWFGLQESDARWKQFSPFARWILDGDGQAGASEGPQGPRFGTVIRPTDPALASHLGLKPGEGVVVRQVEPASLAEKSGVKAHDVVVAINGEKIEANRTEEFRRKLQEALGSKEFTLDVIRQGKPEKILVTPPAPEEKSGVK